MEYIRRQMAAHPEAETKVFFASNGMCRARHVNAFGADCVHVNHLRALLQLYANPFVRPRGRVVFVVHGIHWRKYGFLPRTVGNRVRSALRLALERWLYGRVDELVALNEDDAEMLRTVYHVRRPVRVEPNVVDAVAEPYRPPSFAFVTVARFDFQKGYDVLLDAVALARNDLRAARARLLLIGGGGTFQEMRHRAADAGIDDLLEFAGEVPQAAGEMWRGRILVAPSRWEGSPYVVLEALARGKPVIASACPGNRDLVQNGRNGWLFPTCDARALADLLAKHAGDSSRLS